MKSHFILTMIYFGLVIRNINTSCTDDVKDKCIETHNHYITEVKSFLKKLSKSTKTNEISDTTGRTHDSASDGECNHEDGSSTCDSERLLGSLDVKWKIVKYEHGLCILVEIAQNDFQEEKDFILKCCERYSWTTTQDPSLCTPCNTQFTGDANYYTSTSRGAGQGDKSTDATKSDTDRKMSCKEEPLQETHIVIASVSSFLCGVLVTLFMMCAYNCIFKRNSNDSIGQDAAELKPEILEERKSKLQVDQKTYESLTRTECLTTEQPLQDQVYLCLDHKSESDKLSDTKIVGNNAIQTKSFGSLKKSQIYEQTNDTAAEHHVYNILTSEDASKFYEDAGDAELTEHTGLETQDLTNESINQSSLVPDDHNYFLLEDEVDIAIQDKKAELHKTESQAEEMKGDDDQPDINHAYFSMEKGDHQETSNEQYGASESKSCSDGHVYIALEKV